MNKKILKILNGVSTGLVAAVVILAFLLVGVRFIGFDVYVVLSGSMEPTYQTGSLIYVKEVDPMTLENGDPVTFRVSEDTLVTHRIVEVVPDTENPNNQYFRTKGDANEMEDGSLVACNQVVGKPVFSIPQLGYLASYIQQPPGMYIAVSVAAGLMLFVLLTDSLAGESDKPQKKKKRKENENEPEEKPEQEEPSDTL
ncbi:MAG: signal peptidase I [Peptococcaceae bacterium]|nr:signal peptidase I [Peptococcaceae bacterium]